MAIPPDIFKKELPNAVIFFGVDFIFDKRYTIPKESPVTASAIPENIPMAAPPESANPVAD